MIVSLLLSAWAAPSTLVVVAARSAYVDRGGEGGPAWEVGVEPPLSWTCEDAARVAHLGRLGFERVVAFGEGCPSFGPGVVEGGASTLDNIASTLAGLAGGRPLDVTLFVSAHGARAERGDHAYVFLPADVPARGAVRDDQLRAALDDALAGGAVHSVYADTCYGALLGAFKGTVGPPERILRPPFEAGGRRVTVASSETTMEVPSLRAGIVSLALASGWLGGAELNGDGLVDAGELAGWLAAWRDRFPMFNGLSVRAPSPLMPADVAAGGGAAVVVGSPDQAWRWTVTADVGAYPALVLGVVDTRAGAPLALRLVAGEAYELCRTPLDRLARTPVLDGPGCPRIECASASAREGVSLDADALAWERRACAGPQADMLWVDRDPDGVLRAIASAQVELGYRRVHDAALHGYWGGVRSVSLGLTYAYAQHRLTGHPGWVGGELGGWFATRGARLAWGGQLGLFGELPVDAPSGGVLGRGMAGLEISLAAWRTAQVALRVGPGVDVVVLRRREEPAAGLLQWGAAVGVDVGLQARFMVDPRVGIGLGVAWVPRLVLAREPSGDGAVRGAFEADQSSSSVSLLLRL